jgi:membrane associated rhomboid family serine protease
MTAASNSPQRARTPRTQPRLPWGTCTILALLGMAYALDERSRVDLGVGPIELPELWVLAGDHVRPWQLLSYAFIHADLTHLLGNAASILVGGVLLERSMGAARVIFAFGGLAALVGLTFHLTDASDLYGCSCAHAAMLAYYAGRTAMARDLTRGARIAGALPLVMFVLVSDAWPRFLHHVPNGSKVHWIGVATGLVMALALRLLAPAMHHVQTKLM